MGALSHHHVEVRPGTLPRTSRVVQASSRPAQWPRESPGTIMGVGKNAEETYGGVDGYVDCGCKWTAKQRRWTIADPGFRNLSHIIVLGALEVLIW